MLETTEAGLHDLQVDVEQARQKEKGDGEVKGCPKDKYLALGQDKHLESRLPVTRTFCFFEIF